MVKMAGSSDIAAEDVLCLMWCGTAGLGGHLLGTDEENIVYLRYLVYHLHTQQVLAEHQFIVKPPVATAPSSHHHHSSSSNSSDGDSSSDAAGRVHISDHCHRDYQLTSDRLQSCGESLETVLQKVEDILDTITTCLDTNTPYTNNIHNNHASSQDGSSNDTNSSSPQPSSTPSHKQSPNRPILICDGQLHLRQVLHPKCAFHCIDLPATYNSFFDLRKEFRQYYHTDEMNNLQDMLNHLQLSMDDEENLGTRATRAMLKIIAKMVQDGHVFTGPEQIHVKLEPGVVAKGEEVDSGCVVRARGLPWMSTDVEIAKFFRGLNLAKGGVALCLSPQGRRNGEALIRFECSEHRDMALRRHKHHMGGRYIEVYKATGEDFISVAHGNNNEASQFLSRGNLIIRMRGLPYDCTAKQVVDFFQSGEEGVKLLDNEDGVLFVRKPDGRATGDAFVMLATEEDVNLAIKKHKQSIGSRYIELFRSSSTEVMNRSMDLRHVDQPSQSLPLIAQLPQIQLLPQQSVAHGPRKDCVRLRGLPFEAQIENVLEFLGEFAKHIMFRGVHMVFTPHGQPSGEAFIQMTDEHSAWSCAQQKHNRYMFFGKKNRYIEVFQCSGDDMNFVLSGATPVTPTAPPNATAPPRPIVPTPGAGNHLLSHFGTAYPLGPAPTVLGHTLTPTARLAPYPTAPPPPPPALAAAHYPVYYWPYPSPPVSPTSPYYSSLPPHTIISGECIPYHAEIPMHPGEAVATM